MSLNENLEWQSLFYQKRVPRDNQPVENSFDLKHYMYSSRSHNPNQVEIAKTEDQPEPQQGKNDPNSVSAEEQEVDDSDASDISDGSNLTSIYSQSNSQRNTDSPMTDLPTNKPSQKVERRIISKF